MSLRIAYTDERRILAIARPTDEAKLLKTKEVIVKNWYYKQPQELESFLKAYPDKEDDILKAFAYWVMQKVMGFNENQNQYGTLKRELQNFSKRLFTALRSIAGRIGEQIKKFIRPQKKIKTIY
ncbi:MAG: hypothetical protein ACD_80C00111G0008 [uncultured bacterium (gcode 4)]|uniref:Uncharacterized protein n=1 Tax=uncultured bacterium (gcode 4) TaxID=1234023 RepID=K1XJ39_9BACT|nr:MAG: hypothetical protein ACD_80C00111G0008 [uncultured bacterium (gcode 4)]HBB03378.1 hypothetical protein [Candidatus Gracilibacteria bacterium]